MGSTSKLVLILSALCVVALATAEAITGKWEGRAIVARRLPEGMTPIPADTLNALRTIRVWLELDGDNRFTLKSDQKTPDGRSVSHTRTGTYKRNGANLSLITETLDGKPLKRGVDPIAKECELQSRDKVILIPESKVFHYELHRPG